MKGRQPPKATAPPKKNTYRTFTEARASARAVQEEAAAVRKKVDQYLARVQAVQKANDFVARARAVQKQAEEAIRMADETLASRETKARTGYYTPEGAQRASNIKTALAVGLGALAIGEAGRHAYNRIQRGQAAAQLAERGGGRARRSNLEILPAVATQENYEL